MRRTSAVEMRSHAVSAGTTAGGGVGSAACRAAAIIAAVLVTLEITVISTRKVGANLGASAAGDTACESPAKAICWPEYMSKCAPSSAKNAQRTEIFGTFSAHFRQICMNIVLPLTVI